MIHIGLIFKYLRLIMLFFFQDVNHPEINIFAPENGWLEYDSFPLGQEAYFSGATVDGRNSASPGI